MKKHLTASLALAAFTIATPVHSFAQGVDDQFPFLSACVDAPLPSDNTTMKALVIRLGSDAAICFDTELLRVSAAWTSPSDWSAKQAKANAEVRTSFPGWSERLLKLKGVAFDGSHGGHPSIAGTQVFGTHAIPGWDGADAQFKDPRPSPYGPLPESAGRYNGLYVNGSEVTLSYTVRGSKVLERPSLSTAAGLTGFVRTFQIDRTKETLNVLLAETDLGKPELRDGVVSYTSSEGAVTRIGASGLPAQATLAVQGGRVLLQLPKGAGGTFQTVTWTGPSTQAGQFSALLQEKPRKINTSAGPAHWPQEVVTKGVLGASQTPDGAYVVDKLTPPENNPWKRRVRFGGLDFFSDGKRAALSTWDGDIWIVSGIDQGLENLKWKRFASGGYETLGLAIVKDVIYTSGRDQITRYTDLNKDGEADYYENFNNQVTSSTGFHEFQFDLQTDAKGNFYTAKAGPVRGGGRGFGGGGGNGEITDSAGTVQKISKDGKTREIYATGFRAPNGIGVRADGQVTTGDNEGTWVPACPINWLKPGGFYGVEDLAHKNPMPEYNKPLCWLSHGEYDNSGGGQVWVTSDKWGPFKGEMLHMSYGKCALYLVMKQDLGNQLQGGVTRFPLNFTSSAMRARFNKADGQLYIAGLRGWQTSAANLTGLDRVRYTGKPVYMADALSVDSKGIHIRFTQPVDAKDAADVQNYGVQVWNYRRSSDYGSPELKLSNPAQRGRDRLEITSAEVAADGKSVTLKVADLKPAMQSLVKYSVKAKDGTALKQEIQHTIHQIPTAK